MRISDWSSDVCSADLRGAHEGLIAVVVEAHRDDRAALRKHAFGQVRGTLRDQAERDAAFAALLGASRQDAPDRGAIGVLLAGDVTVRPEERRVGKEGVSTFRFRWST